VLSVLLVHRVRLLYSHTCQCGLDRRCRDCRL